MTVIEEFLSLLPADPVPVRDVRVVPFWTVVTSQILSDKESRLL